MRAGLLRHKFTVRTMTEEQDAAGELVQTWADGNTIWGSITPLSGGESLSNEQITAEVTHKVWVRYDSTVTPGTRLLFGSRVFEINSVLNKDERNVAMELLCKEIV